MTLGVKPTACECHRVYLGGSLPCTLEAGGHNPRREADGM